MEIIYIYLTVLPQELNVQIYTGFSIISITIKYSLNSISYLLQDHNCKSRPTAHEICVSCCHCSNLCVISWSFIIPSLPPRPHYLKKENMFSWSSCRRKIEDSKEKDRRQQRESSGSLVQKCTKSKDLMIKMYKIYIQRTEEMLCNVKLCQG